MKNQAPIFNKIASFQYNPFGGITTDELPQVIVHRKETKKILSIIHSDTNAIIEIVGKKGRGKTTHLTYFQQQFPEHPIFYLDEKSLFHNSILDEKIIFIDSIHHFSFFQRVKIFNKIPKVIYTTHYRRPIEYLFSQKQIFSFRFEGLDSQTLLQVLEKRILLALKNQESSVPKINIAYIDNLLKKYNDDFRGIMNHLYADFQNMKLND